MSQPLALLLAFSLIVTLTNRRVPLPLAMLTGSTVLGLGLGPLRTLILRGLSDRLELPAAVRAAINLVFRHACHFVFPFLPSLILASSLAGMSVHELVRLLWPLAHLRHLTASPLPDRHPRVFQDATGAALQGVPAPNDGGAPGRLDSGMAARSLAGRRSLSPDHPGRAFRDRPAAAGSRSVRGLHLCD